MKSKLYEFLIKLAFKLVPSNIIILLELDNGVLGISNVNITGFQPDVLISYLKLFKIKSITFKIEL